MATKNEVRVWINDVNYTQYIDLPASITDKNLEESLNLITLNLKKMTKDEPFAPIQRSLIQVLSGGSVADEFKYLLLNDRYKKLGYNNLYDHSLTFIESTYILSTIPVPNKTITRITGIYEPTLYSALLRLINTVSRATDYGIVISSELATELNKYPCPEWTFTGRNLLEVVRMMLSLAKLIPFVEWVSDTQFTIKYKQITNNITTALNRYFLKEGTYDPRTYTTSLFSDVSNFLAGEERPIVEPANGWMIAKSPDGAGISADALEFRTKYPIYKIKKAELIKHLRVNFSSSGDNYSVIIPRDKIAQEWFVDRAPFLFEQSYWEALLNREDYGQKGGSFFYKQGETKIKNLDYTAPTWSSFFNPSMQAWRNVLKGYYGSTSSNSLPSLVKTEYITQVESIINTEILAVHGIPSSQVFNKLYRLSPHDDHTKDYDHWNYIKPWEIKLRITYIPLINTSLYSYRELRDTDRFRTYRPYNQQTNVISNEVLGELHEKVLRRGNGDSETVSIIHEDYIEAAASGEKLGDYVITTKEVEINLYTVKVTYTLNKFEAHLKKYAAILEEYRQYRIPNENIVRSQRTFHKFAKFGFEQGLNNTNKLDVSMFISNKEINLMKMGLYNIVLSALSYNFNNTLVFEAEMESNVVAGRSVEYLTNNYYKETPIRYTDENGMIETTSYFKFGRDFESFTNQDSLNLPKYMGNLKDEFYNEIFFITKDAREQLAISLQIHHMVEDERIHLNEGFTRNSGLIGGAGHNSDKFKMAFLGIKPHNEKFLNASDILEEHFLGFYAYSNGGYVATTHDTNNSGHSAASWAFIDTSNNEVLFWVDEEVVNGAATSNIYINFTDEY